MFNISDVLWCELPWLDLLNSDWHDHQGSGRTEDRLEHAAWQRYFFSRWRYNVRGIPKEKLLSELRELRTVIRRVAEKYARNVRVTVNDWRRINKYLKRAPSFRQFRLSDGTLMLDYLPLGEKLDVVLGDIAESFAATVAEGEPLCIKICQNNDCRWIFYDTSKNRSRKWCDSTCGTLMKVRRFRLQRKKS
ncbi:MAG: hypothetical protein A2Y62_19860 [Candidatus Fischerbacteria bacterium RBG_13_37_8]|uniref:Zinc finger CGNR domain-containing protein n=1 Tax=Candidatus Fischerbacteria bacterium RBG_13_37_8 TaxID=1817863 RepID=A0A1F5VNT3_9BACT|nr:MAG: hypothetical protein A2Y62_19860 [Candidatus Fischerbacteria bacterium RBG_13_37_8]